MPLIAWLLIPPQLIAAPGAVDPVDLLKRGHFTTALPLLEARVTSDASDALDHYYLGFCLLQLQRFADGERELRLAVAAEPRRANWHHALAKAQLEQGKYKDAMASLDRAIALDPSPDYRFAKAVTASNVGLGEVARGELDAVLRARPDDAEALFLRGQLAANAGDDRAALTFFRRCRDADPKHLEARFRLGLAERRVGDATIAITELEAVLREVPGHVGALYNLSQLLMARGQKAEARKQLEQFQRASEVEDRIQFQSEFVKLDPANLDKRSELARLQLESGATAAALRTLDAARLLDPTHRPTMKLLVAALERLGRHGDAASVAAHLAALERKP